MTGFLMKNKFKQEEKHPDYTGEITIGATTYRLSAWLKQSKSGSVYMSLSARHKSQQDVQGVIDGQKSS